MAMPRREESKFCPPPKVVEDFCLEQCYPQFLFRYMMPRQPPENGERDVELARLVLTISPADFVLQLDGDRRTSDRISADLSALYAGERRRDYAMTDEFLHPGVPVAARYFVSEDLRWYRAIVVDVDRSRAEKPVRIRFVDFGNYQQNDPIELKMLPVDMGNEPPMAIKARLKGTNEDSVFQRPIIELFQNWAHRILKEQKCLVSFCFFDAAANQYITRLFNAENGEEFKLPPGSVAAQPSPSTSGAAAATAENVLIELDDDKGSSNVDLLGPISAQAAPPLAPVRASSFEEELKTIFAAVSISGAASSGAAVSGVAANVVTANGDEIPSGVAEAQRTPDDGDGEVEGVEKEAQTDITLIDRAERAESAEGDADTYDPFTDPRYKNLMEKYPNLMKYLKG